MQKKLSVSYNEFYDNTVDIKLNFYLEKINKEITKKYLIKIFTFLKEKEYYEYLLKYSLNNKSKSNELYILQVNSDLEAIIEDFENSLYETENPNFDIPKKVYDFRINMITDLTNFLQKFILLNYI